MQQSLLIEIGTEELPVKALPGLAQALFDGVLEGLDRHGVGYERSDAKPLYSPRRLAVLLPEVTAQQPDQTSESLGPYTNLALDAQGAPTRALQGFAAKSGVDWTALHKTTDSKGERYVHRATKLGARTIDLLPQIVHQAVSTMPIPKPMRWGDHDYAFVRPVQWLVLLFGDAVVEAELFGLRAGRESRGHRFLAQGPVSIATPAHYVAALRAAKVLVDPDERRTRIETQVADAAKAVTGVARIDADNLEQVNCLVEWPVAVTCSFESEFLAVPSEALIATMEANQKFFPVLRDSGALSEYFIGVANIESKDVTAIRSGYERVIRPRFADAKFFFEEDLKQGLASMGAGLTTVTYQTRLGTMAEKVQRVATLATVIAAEVNVDPTLARQAAELSKNDLQSRMVNEFPELQGIAGRHYALAAGVSSDIALAIDEAYQPRYAGDDIALSPLGKVLAIAERLDTLVGGFAAGLKPSGNKDPFALRRNALGMARTIIESGFDLNLRELLRLAAGNISLTPATQRRDSAADEARRTTTTPAADAAASQAEPGCVTAQIHDDIYDFIIERLRGYYTDKGVDAQLFNAVAAKRPDSLYDFDRRLDAIGVFAQLPEAQALAAANKRIGNLLKKSQVGVGASIDYDLLIEPAERALAESVEAVYAETGAALARGDYVDALGHLARLRPQVDAFFEQVMVNVEDQALRRNRLALLQRLADRLGSVAAIEHLSV